MDVAEMMPPTEQLEVTDPTTVTAQFDDRVTARLAVEPRIRDIPIGRRRPDVSAREPQDDCRPT